MLLVPAPPPPRDESTLAAPCPSCGKPRALMILTPRLRCVACGVEGDVDPAILAAAKAYRDARANVPMSLTQAGHVEELARSIDEVFGRLRRTLALLFAPSLVLFAIGLHDLGRWSDEYRRLTAFDAPAFLAPLVVLVALAVPLVVSMRRRRRAIDALLWAQPTGDPKMPLGCRLCGAPLATDAMTRAVIRCPFCSSDNLVGPEVSRAAARTGLKSYVERANDVLRGARKGPRGVLLGVLPIAVFVVLLLGGKMLGRSLANERRPARADAAYVVGMYDPSRPSDKTRCAYAAHDAPDHATEPLALGDLVGVVPAHGDMRWQIGWNVWHPRNRVVGVMSDGLGRHLVRARRFDGVDGQALLHRFCWLPP